MLQENPFLCVSLMSVKEGQKDPLEKQMATYSSILVWEIPWTEEPGHGVAKSRTQLSEHTHDTIL